MHRNQSVNQHQFALIPKSDIPRSMFKRETAYKTTLDAGGLIPFFVDEVLPGDEFNFDATLFGRIATPLVPFMDNLYADTFYFFVPNRLVWDNWVKLQGQQTNPGDSIDYLVPQLVSPDGGYFAMTLGDYFGLPTKNVITPGNTISHSTLPFRAYNLIYNEWFRDQNLQNSLPVPKGDGPDNQADYTLKSRGKRKDYFTSCLPFAQKGAAVTLPIGSQAPIKSTGVSLHVRGGTGTMVDLQFDNTTGNPVSWLGGTSNNSQSINLGPADSPIGSLYADLSQATASTVSMLRTSFQVQKLLERDARGGTRYSEMLQAHFGVNPQDFRLQRPEYIGGGSTPINISPIAQTQGTGASGTSTPLGQLAAMGTLLARNNGFRYSALEHGHIIGLVSIRADLTYQQGLRKLWSRRTRYDFYMPEFAMLGEQAVLNKEIFVTGDSNQDNDAFGYQERWAEYRYFPSQITGLFKSTDALPLDIWHLAQEFDTLPTLNSTFITENPPIDRVIAVPSQPQFLLDVFMKIRTVRPLPLYSVPGLIDHF